MPKSRYQQSSDWSTPTSSSENESISSTIDTLAQTTTRINSFHLVNEHGQSEDDDGESENDLDSRLDDNRISHKVLKLRKLLLEAVQCGLTIIWEYHFLSNNEDIPPITSRPRNRGSQSRSREENILDLNVKEPWMKLSRCLIALKRAIGSNEIPDPPSLAVQKLIWYLMDLYITRFTEDKVYTKQKIGKNEAKAIPSLLKVWEKMKSQGGLDEVDEQYQADRDVVLQDAPVIVLRLVTFTLLGQEKGVLDFSGLQVKSPEVWQYIDLLALCRTFAIDSNQVLHITLSHNSWHYMPSNLARDLPLFPLLRRLDISHNPALQYLPISLLKSSMTRITARQTQLKENTNRLILIKSIDELATTRPINASSHKGIPSLSSICTQITHNALSKLPIPQQTEQLSSLPPHLAELIKSTYSCALCDESQAQYIGSRGWMAKEVIRAWAVEGKTMPRRLPSGQLREVWAASKIIKIRGRVCRYCLGKYLTPSDAYD